MENESWRKGAHSYIHMSVMIGLFSLMMAPESQVFVYQLCGCFLSFFADKRLTLATLPLLHEMLLQPVLRRVPLYECVNRGLCTFTVIQPPLALLRFADRRSNIFLISSPTTLSFYIPMWPNIILCICKVARRANLCFRSHFTLWIVASGARSSLPCPFQRDEPQCVR